MFGQIVFRKTAMSVQTFFYFSTASGTLHEDLRTFYVSWWHKFAIKPLLCNTVFAYSCQLQVAQQHTQNAVLCFHCNNSYTNTAHFYVLHILLILFWNLRWVTCNLRGEVISLKLNLPVWLLHTVKIKIIYSIIIKFKASLNCHFFASML
jgi:hypothetical protein